MRAFANTMPATPMLLLLLPMLAFAADDLDRLLGAVAMAPGFADERPAFTVATQTFPQATADGEITREYHIIRDRGRAVAILDERACQLDWITARPDQAREEVVLPRVYSWVSLLGCRISTVAWIDGQGPSGEQRAHRFDDGGETLTLTVSESWTEKRVGESVYTFTLRLDPVLGYVWDLSTTIAVDTLPTRKDKVHRDVELLNIQPGRIADPWPDRWRYDRTVFSRASGEGFIGFVNNLVAADRSDNGNRLAMRPGALTAFLSDADGWGVALVRSEEANVEHAPNSTCNVWLDQHNKVRFPETPDADGRHRISTTWRWVGLPPPLTERITAQTELIGFNERAVMLRLGGEETFEDQPLPLDTVHRGLWTWGLEVDGTHARSGAKALRVKGVERLDGNTGRFIAPFVPLDATATYELSAWVWVEGPESARFFICSGEAKVEEGPMRHRSTNRVGPAGAWQRVTWTIKGRGTLDLRLILLGAGATAWVDDVSLERKP